MDKLAYSIAELAEAVSLSEDMLDKEIKSGRLIPSYVGARKLVARAEADRWLASLPAERQVSS